MVILFGTVTTLGWFMVFNTYQVKSRDSTKQNHHRQKQHKWEQNTLSWDAMHCLNSVTLESRSWRGVLDTHY
jgi:hypothetical protein